MADKTDIPTDDACTRDDATSPDLGQVVTDEESSAPSDGTERDPTSEDPESASAGDHGGDGFSQTEGNPTASRDAGATDGPAGGDGESAEDGNPGEGSGEETNKATGEQSGQSEQATPDGEDSSPASGRRRPKHAVKVPTRRKRTRRGTTDTTGDLARIDPEGEVTTESPSPATDGGTDAVTTGGDATGTTETEGDATERRPARQPTRKAPTRRSKARATRPGKKEGKTTAQGDGDGSGADAPTEPPAGDGTSHATRDGTQDGLKRRPTRRTGAGSEDDGKQGMLAGMPSISDIFKSENRVPVILGIITIACLIVTVTSLGLRWMAQHGGGTGNPVEASSEVDNTPIPVPHVTGVDMINLSFRASTTFRISSGDKSIAWDGEAVTGDLKVQDLTTANDTTLVAIAPKDGMGELTIDFACPDDQAFISFSASMSTEDNGALMLTGSANNLPHEGTARVAFKDYLFGMTNDGSERIAMPVVNVTTSYTVGDGNPDYVGSYVSCSSSLSMGIGTTEAYLATGTRSVKASAPQGFGQGDILQTGRTTIRPDGRQNAITGTALMASGEKEYEATYEKLAENDESSKIMGRDVSHIDAGNNAITNGGSEEAPSDDGNGASHGDAGDDAGEANQDE